MNFKISLVVTLFVLAACSKPESETVEPPAEPAAVVELPEASEPAAAVEPPEASEPAVDTSTIQITDGLSAKVLQEGDGEPAEVGQIAIVHYTGWLYDESAENNRGDKFDSSVDRKKPFPFMLGAGRVIKGWDQGVVDMKVGEKRELTIAPEMGYGDRGAGAVIPPGSTLIFEIEMLEIQGAEPAPAE